MFGFQGVSVEAGQMSLSSSEIVPYVVGAVITIAIARWLFSRVDYRPPNTPSLYFSYSPDQESVSELQRMFPNIPRAYIIRELDRASGSSAVAIDALLLINPDFPAEASPSNSLAISPELPFPTTHQAIIADIISNSDSSEVINEPVISRKEWETADPQARQRVLAERKKSMLLKARESFRKSQEGSS